MKVQKTVGILAFHGDVVEHMRATQRAAENLAKDVNVISITTKGDLQRLHALIIPGGESTTLYKLSVREGMWEDMKKIPHIFGTCAGAIMLATEIRHKIAGQQSLERMDMTIDRNAYGRQTDSFEKEISTALGTFAAIFIRAPKILRTGKNVRILAKNGLEIIACEEETPRGYSLAACFHPEFSTTRFHEYFLKKLFGVS